VIGFQIAGLFEYNFGDSEIMLLMWFIIGMMMVGRNNVVDRSIEKELK
jgi:hypothetical protein